jgi:hypothetical protein
VSVKLDEEGRLEGGGVVKLATGYIHTEDAEFIDLMLQSHVQVYTTLLCVLRYCRAGLDNRGFIEVLWKEFVLFLDIAEVIDDHVTVFILFAFRSLTNNISLLELA